VQLSAPLDRQGRVQVGADCSLAHDHNIFVLGDQAHFEQDGAALPGLAPVAIQQGRFVARQLKRDLKRRERQVFRYVDKGTMATIGRRRAVAEIGKLHFGGLFAWYLWLLIHIYFLIGFKNRFFVLWQWFYSYITYRRGARLITERDWHSNHIV
jgi:NADH dehydrogenase